MPSTAPAPSAMMFLSAPQSSTPTTSAFVYTRNIGVPTSARICRAIAGSAEAMTVHVVRGARPFGIGGHLPSVGHAYAGEVFAILASRRDLFGLRGVSGPEDHVLATVAREDRREGRAPGSRLEHGHRHEVPTRGST